MSSIDDRVVNMQFNNAQFQKGIGETTNSLDSLKEGLKLDGATEGINEVQAAGSRFSLANMESAIQNISSKFNVFGAIGFTVIQNLVNSALDAGKRIAGSLIDPLVQGGAKRALALQQAKFQFRGLGLDISKTMAVALAAVKGTSFGLDEAATAAAILGTSGVTAGHGLEGALRGIAGVAAQTGSSYSEIADIFSNVSGQTRLMGSDLLRLSSRGVNAAAVLAKALGVSESKVRDMVSKGKVSFKEFSKAMDHAFGANAAKANETYSGALANMHAALARIGADVASPYFLGMRDIFNALGPLFDDIHTAILPLINDFASFQTDSATAGVAAISKLFGPALVSSITNVVVAIREIGNALSGGFRQIFPDNTPNILKNVGNFLKTITAALIPGAVAASELQRTFAGLFALFDIVGQIIGAVVNTIFNLIGVTSGAGGSILSFTANIGDWIVKVDEFLKRGNYFQDFFRTVGAIIAIPISILKTFFGIVSDGFDSFTHLNSSGFDTFADDLKARFSGLVELGNFFNTVWHGVQIVAEAVWSVLKPIFIAIGTFAGQIGDAIKKMLDGLSFDQAIQAVNTGILGGFLLAINGFFGTFKGMLAGNGVAILGPFKAIMTGLRVNLKALEMNTNAKTLTQIAIAVALLAASAVALSLVDSDKLVIALGAISGMMASLLATFAVFQKISGVKGLVETLALVAAIQGIAFAILVLSGAIAILGALPLQNLVQGVLALGVTMLILVGALKLLSSSGPAVLFAAGAIALIAPAIAVLAGAIAILGALPIANLALGVGALVVTLAALVGALALMGSLGPEILFGAVAIAIIAPAIALLAGAIAIFAALPLLNLLVGVGAFVVVLAALVGALAILSLLGPEVLFGALAIGAVALAMVPLVGAIALLGAIPLANLVSGVVALVAVLVILSAAVLLLGLAGPASLIGAAAIVAIALALAVLAPALKLLSTISWDEIGRTLTILAAGLGILVVMGILLIPASVGFLLLGVALVLIGTGIGLAAQGIGTLALGIAALVAAGAGGIALLTAGITAFIGQLPALGAGIGAAIVAMAVVIGQDAPKLVQAFVSILLAMLSAIDQILPKIIKVATDIIVALVNALVILIPKLYDAGLKIIVGVLQGINSHIRDIAKLAISIVANFINGIADGLPRLIKAGINLIISFVNGLANGIRDNTKRMNKAGQNLAGAIIDGMTSGIRSAAGAVVRAITGVANGAINTAKKLLGIKSPSRVFRAIGAFLSQGLAIGITELKGLVLSASQDVGQSAVDGVKSSVSGISDALDVNIDSSPTIRPVMDLTDIQNKAKQINGLIPTPTLSVDTSNDVAASVSLQEQARNAQLSIEQDRDPKTGDTINFTQNNSSPKALSTTEIYRQTQNQLSTLKGDLGVVDQSGGTQ